jgi:hypothetical protein
MGLVSVWRQLVVAAGHVNGCTHPVCTWQGPACTPAGVYERCSNVCLRSSKGQAGVCVGCSNVNHATAAVPVQIAMACMAVLAMSSRVPPNPVVQLAYWQVNSILLSHAVSPCVCTRHEVEHGLSSPQCTLHVVCGLVCELVCHVSRVQCTTSWLHGLQKHGVCHGHLNTLGRKHAVTGVTGCCLWLGAFVGEAWMGCCQGSPALKHAAAVCGRCWRLQCMSQIWMKNTSAALVVWGLRTCLDMQ